MAEIWGAAIVGGSSLLGGLFSSNAAGDAAQDQENEAAQSLALQKQEHDQTVAGLQPYNTAGTNALAIMNQLNSGNFSSFTASPDYQFALQQGIKAMDASAAAKGTLFSGGYGQAMQQYGQGLATQNYDNYYNHLAGVASLGENAAAMVGNSNSGYANAATNINTNAGEAAAMGTLGQASAYNNALGQLTGAFNQFNSSYNNGSPSSFSGPTGNYLSNPANFTNDFSSVGGGSFNLANAGIPLGN